VDQHSSSEEKIRLFRSLFRGREDVYPRRFESRNTGRAGYAPACANEWVKGVCEKPRIKCAECPNRRFLPVTDGVIRWHLSGQDAEGQPFVAGRQGAVPLMFSCAISTPGAVLWMRAHNRLLRVTGMCGRVAVRSNAPCPIMRCGSGATRLCIQ